MFAWQIEPQLLSGKHVMIAAHGNSLRSIIMYLDKLTSQEVITFALKKFSVKVAEFPMSYFYSSGVERKVGYV